MKRCRAAESSDSDSDEDEEEEATAPQDEGSSSSDPVKDNVEALPPWKAVYRGPRPSIWKGEAGKVYWHVAKKVKVVGVSASKGKVVFRRACATCNQPTLGMDQAFCGKKACGGKRQVKPPCSFEQDGKKCTLPSHRLENGKRLCHKHWVQANPAERACPRCQKWPRCKSSANGWCGACVRNDKVESVKKAQRVALEALMAAEGIAEWPGAAKATSGTRYATLNRLNGHAPHVVVKAGSQPVHACEHPNCCQMAHKNLATGETRWCIHHGGGHRCQQEHCTRDDRGLTPHAKYWLEGTRTCLGCMLSLNPANKKLRSCSSKEQLLACANELEFPELQIEALDRPECDATIGTGKSRRRIDMGWTRQLPTQSSPFKLANECDEGGPGGHQSGQGCYSLDGQSGKWSGHMSDLGAPAISERDANWVDAQTLSKAEAAGDAETHKTKKMDRILGAATEASARMMPFRVVSLQVDEYVDCHGVKHPSAFVCYRIGGKKDAHETSGEKRVRTRDGEFAHRYACNARELHRLMALGTEGPSFVHSKLFYNGSDPETGLPPVAKEASDEASSEEEEEEEEEESSEQSDGDEEEESDDNEQSDGEKESSSEEESDEKESLVEESE